MDKQLKILLILHFAVKHKDKTHSSEETYRFIGLTQNQISQYLSGKCKMPRCARIAMLQHIKHSKKLKKETHKLLDSLDTRHLKTEDVDDLIAFIRKHGRLDVPRGRTETVASKILELYESLDMPKKDTVVE